MSVKIFKSRLRKFSTQKVLSYETNQTKSLTDHRFWSFDNPLIFFLKFLRIAEFERLKDTGAISFHTKPID